MRDGVALTVEEAKGAPCRTAWTDGTSPHPTHTKGRPPYHTVPRGGRLSPGRPTREAFDLLHGHRNPISQVSPSRLNADGCCAAALPACTCWEGGRARSNRPRRRCCHSSALLSGPRSHCGRPPCMCPRSQHVQLGGVVVSRPSGFWPPKYHRRRIAVTLIEAESNVNVRVDQCPPPWAREGASIHSHIYIRFLLD